MTTQPINAYGDTIKIVTQSGKARIIGGGYHVKAMDAARARRMVERDARFTGWQ